MWKKLLGWTLFVCGILGGLYILILPISHLLEFLVSLLKLLDSAKSWGLIGAGILIWLGWWLAHKERER